ncbi:lisH domain-containing protein ARMC9-like [Actinia tenebrosa]|uniref:LisH domain-containing protein ARMC9-like n=1 Tax=Actinia tenebrosa TaxID=6105 RepID=A0A6P8HBU5_ACTTE|nr:lisH domain-containing protein ARMC9-like [Actinia tenebrosa]
MDAVIAVEPDLNAIINEYLHFLGYEKTCATLSEELRVLGKPEITSGTPLRNDSQISEMQTQALIAFDNGKYQDFFPIWNNQVPSSVQNMASTCQKLEFNLHIYFAVYPITNGRHNKLELERSMRVFKSYLENKGSGLSQTTEFLPFYALPFVPDPTTHPSFKPIFTVSIYTVPIRLFTFNTLTYFLVH